MNENLKKELLRIMRDLNAPIHILSIIGSIDDTLTEKESIDLLSNVNIIKKKEILVNGGIIGDKKD